jgi:hypothetical protein
MEVVMRVYADVLPPWLGTAMYRLNRELRRHAPAGIEFVGRPGAADLQVLDVIGMGSLEFLCHQQYVLIQHCYLTTEDPGGMSRADFWLPHFRNARLVVSHYDLPSLLGAADFPFYRTPLGVDGGTFFDRLRRPRPACVLTTGHDPAGEAIRECRDAAGRVNQPMIHVGSHFDFMGDGCLVVSGVSDDVLARLYSEARYVSGLRRGEGFELPVIEGLACGARPICFDMPGYRDWFDGHAVFVPETGPEELTDAITEILRMPPVPVGAEERDRVLERFSWRRIVEGLWREVLGSAPRPGTIRSDG